MIAGPMAAAPANTDRRVQPLIFSPPMIVSRSVSG
jgi:hypothetical protein